MPDSKSIAFEASPQLIKEIRSIAAQSGAEVSNPTATTSVADALDSPIGGEEIKQILELLIVAFKAGGAAITFFTAVRGVLNKYPNEAVVVKNPLAGEKRGVITKDT